MSYAEYFNTYISTITALHLYTLRIFVFFTVF